MQKSLKPKTCVPSGRNFYILKIYKNLKYSNNELLVFVTTTSTSNSNSAFYDFVTVKSVVESHGRGRGHVVAMTHHNFSPVFFQLKIKSDVAGDA